MNVSDFLISHGVEKLHGQRIKHNEKVYKIVITQDDSEYHSLKNEDWKGSQETLDKYHLNGNYRFYAMDENEMCVWVYKSTELLQENEVVTKYGNVLLVEEYGQKKVDFNNSKFNSTQDFIGFLQNEQLITQILK